MNTEPIAQLEDCLSLLQELKACMHDRDHKPNFRELLASPAMVLMTNRIPPELCYEKDIKEMLRLLRGGLADSLDDAIIYALYLKAERKLQDK